MWFTCVLCVCVCVLCPYTLNVMTVIIHEPVCCVTRPLHLRTVASGSRGRGAALQVGRATKTRKRLESDDDYYYLATLPDGGASALADIGSGGVTDSPALRVFARAKSNNSKWGRQKSGRGGAGSGAAPLSGVATDTAEGGMGSGNGGVQVGATPAPDADAAVRLQDAVAMMNALRRSSMAVVPVPTSAGDRTTGGAGGDAESAVWMYGKSLMYGTSDPVTPPAAGAPSRGPADTTTAHATAMAPFTVAEAWEGYHPSPPDAARSTSPSAPSASAARSRRVSLRPPRPGSPSASGALLSRAASPPLVDMSLLVQQQHQQQQHVTGLRRRLSSGHSSSDDGSGSETLSARVSPRPGRRSVAAAMLPLGVANGSGTASLPYRRRPVSTSVGSDSGSDGETVGTTVLAPPSPVVSVTPAGATGTATPRSNRVAILASARLKGKQAPPLTRGNAT